MQYSKYSKFQKPLKSKTFLDLSILYKDTQPVIKYIQRKKQTSVWEKRVTDVS
jgi:hypothetical protein